MLIDDRAILSASERLHVQDILHNYFSNDSLQPDLKNKVDAALEKIEKEVVVDYFEDATEISRASVQTLAGVYMRSLRFAYKMHYCECRKIDDIAYIMATDAETAKKMIALFESTVFGLMQESEGKENE